MENPLQPEHCAEPPVLGGRRPPADYSRPEQRSAQRDGDCHLRSMFPWSTYRITCKSCTSPASCSARWKQGRFAVYSLSPTSCKRPAQTPG